MKMHRFFGVIVILGVLFSCEHKKPTALEGNATLQVTVFDEEGQPSPDAEAVCISLEGQVSKTQMTDSSGTTIFENLPSSEYTVKATKIVNESATYIGSKQIFLQTGEEKTVSVQMRLNFTGLKINEIYYAGPVNNEFYFSDQFIELYNASPDTAFLDGMIIIRGGAGPLAGKDNDNDGNLDFLYFDPVSGKENVCFASAYRFEGKSGVTKKYALAPGAFAVLASDAIDHKLTVPNSIDLSHADFEFYTNNEPRDPNNQNVPDIFCIINGEHSRLVPMDLYLNISTDMVLLASGQDSIYWDGIDLSTIIDGVEYANNKDIIPRLDDRIDQGIAGIMPDEVISKFSGKSIQRIRPGFDTNNSTVDFMILEHPTPGY